jgi:hypothetical protein
MFMRRIGAYSRQITMGHFRRVVSDPAEPGWSGICHFDRMSGPPALPADILVKAEALIRRLRDTLSQFESRLGKADVPSGRPRDFTLRPAKNTA